MSTLTAFDRLAELDRRNVVDVDLGSDEFKANAHRHMAEWARRPPFYVLGKGPPQVVVGRYADVHKVFSDTETFNSEMPQRSGLGAIPQVHGRAVRHADGRRAACPPSPSADAGVLVAPHRAAAGQHHDDHRRLARPDRGERAEVRRHAGPRLASCGGCIARSHDPDGSPAQGDVRRVSRRACRRPPTSSRASRSPEACGRHASARWTRSRSSSTSAARRRVPTSSAIWSTRATPATSSPIRTVRSDLRALRRFALRH